ncbi:hypothetical protein SLE2022_388540 [Rubroshorea leprosula]
MDQFRLPPLLSDKQTVFLDLDNTIVYGCQHRCLCHQYQFSKKYDFKFKITNIEGQTKKYYVCRRPGVDEFLEEISKKYEVVVFTSDSMQYATRVLDALDPKGLISYRLYMDSCRKVDHGHVKDWSTTGRDLSKVVIVDDKHLSYSLQPENGIPILPFAGDVRDRWLQKLTRFFQGCHWFGDTRDAVRQYFSGRSRVGFLRVLTVHWWAAAAVRQYPGWGRLGGFRGLPVCWWAVEVVAGVRMLRLKYTR